MAGDWVAAAVYAGTADTGTGVTSRAVLMTSLTLVTLELVGGDKDTAASLHWQRCS